ncbi:MAG TPA: hypothetical protein DD990_03150 [Cyanobacteria bacterium UBA11368]|nr:hypothetical protein [Cyanobacteria bacterium UBA11368]
MAMLHEVYGAEGAIAYSEIYSVQDLKALLDQTYELRRDPKERESEERQQKAKQWVEENKNKILRVPTGDGNFSPIPLAFFAESD